MVQDACNFAVRIGLTTLLNGICCGAWVKMDRLLIVDSCHSGDIDFLVPLREQQESVYISICQLL